MPMTALPERNNPIFRPQYRRERFQNLLLTQEAEVIVKSQLSLCWLGLSDFARLKIPALGLLTS